MSKRPKPRMLYLTVRVPARTTGADVLELEMLDFLSEYYDIELVCGPGEFDPVVNDLVRGVVQVPESGQGRWGRLLHNSLPRDLSVLDNDFAVDLVSKMRESEQYDVVFCSGIFGVHWLSGDYTSVKCLSVNVEHQLHGAGVKGAMWGQKTKKFEKKVLKGLKGNVALLTEYDSGEIKDWLGIELEVCPPIMKPKKLPKVKVKSNMALITTNAGYEPNRTSMNEFWYNFSDPEGVGIEFVVTGKDQGDFLAKLSKIFELRAFDYRGFVSTEELDELFAEASLVIDPTIAGSGFQIKLLDAMARNKPVVYMPWKNQVGGVQGAVDPEEFNQMILDHFSGKKPVNAIDYDEFYKHATTKLLEFLSKESSSDFGDHA